MKVKTYLNKYRIPLKEFAERVGISENTASFYKTGHREPAAKHAIPIYWATNGQVLPYDVDPKIYPLRSWIPPVKTKPKWAKRKGKV